MLVQVVVSVLVVLQLGAAQQCGVVVTTPDELKHEIRSEITAVLKGNISATLMSGQCGYQDCNINATLEKAVEKIIFTIDQKIATAMETFVKPILNEVSFLRLLGRTSSRPASSCREIKEQDPSTPSGYYWIETSSVPLIRVYCDMTKTCGGITGGWMRVANIDMSKCTETCPEGLKTLTVGTKRLCAMNINGAGCSSTSFTVHGVEYSRVCGKVIGYQQKSPDAFGPYGNNPSRTIDDVYVDGISLTHGCSRRQHIWTFAAALHEVLTSFRNYICPCTNIHNPTFIPIPPFVGNDYFCDTASAQRFQFKFYPNDPLWDGQGCGPLNTCCSFNSPPWFMKQLSTATTDDIEMRLCADSGRSDEDITFETVELYVQ